MLFKIAVLAGFLWATNFFFPAVGALLTAPATLARGASASIELHNIQKLVMVFKTVQGRNPTAAEFDTIMREGLTSKLKDPRLDGWGHAYIYQSTERRFEVRSAGPDGRAFTDDDLVITWEG